MKAPVLIASILSVGSVSVLANPVLDLIEGKSDGSDLYSKFFEEKPDSTPLNAKQRREYTESPFVERPEATKTVYTDADNKYIQSVAVQGASVVSAHSGSIKSDTSGQESQFSSSNVYTHLGAVAELKYGAQAETRLAFNNLEYGGVESLSLSMDVTNAVQPVHSTFQQILLGIYKVAQLATKPIDMISGDTDVLPDASVNGIEVARLRVGKFKPRFGSQYSVDPTLRMTPNLPVIVQQNAPANALGLEYSEYNDFWNWSLGYYADSTDRNIPSWSANNGVMHIGIGYNFGLVNVPSKPAQREFQEVRVDYYNNNSGAGSSVINAVDHVMAFSFLSQSDRVTVNTDFILGNGASTSWGLNLTAGYWLMSDKLQLVGQLEHAGASEDNGINVGWGLPGALSHTTSARSIELDGTLSGNRFNSAYVGLNWYLFEQRLRLMAGAEYRALTNAGSNEEVFDSLTWQGQGIFAF